MGYQRAQWHSGLTYRQQCRECRTVFKYTDEILGFRPWFPDGFVYCPKCNTPNRHNESYAIDGQQTGNVTYAHTAQVDTEAPACATINESVEAPAIEASIVETAIANEPVIEAPIIEETAAPVAFCTKCGKKFNDGDLFCSGCGNKRE